MGAPRPDREAFAAMTDEALTTWITTAVAQCRALPAAVAALLERGVSYEQLRQATGLPPSTAHRWVKWSRSGSPATPRTATESFTRSTLSSTTPP